METILSYLRSHLSRSSPRSDPDQPWVIAPLSAWKPTMHPKAREVADEVQDFFLRHSSGSSMSQAAGERSLRCDMSLSFPCSCPNGKRDRLLCVSKLVTIMFLLDDTLDTKSLEEGIASNRRLDQICRGETLPSGNDAAEWIFYDLLGEMRTHDRALADSCLECLLGYMRSQTDKMREHMDHPGSCSESRSRRSDACTVL